MYTVLNNIKVNLDFNSGIYVHVDGPDNFYYVELLEYKKNDHNPLVVDGHHISKNNFIHIPSYFYVPIEFYVDFEISIYKVVDKIGIVKIFSHRFNDFNQLVSFKLETNDLHEANLWFERIKIYQKIHGCEIMIKSKFEELDKMSNQFYKTNNINPYKTYKIGRFPKSSNDYKTHEKRKEGFLWFGNYKTFWSYQHPKSWTLLTSKNIVDDILGL